MELGVAFVVGFMIGGVFAFATLKPLHMTLVSIEKKYDSLFATIAGWNKKL